MHCKFSFLTEPAFSPAHFSPLLSSPYFCFFKTTQTNQDSTHLFPVLSFFVCLCVSAHIRVCMWVYLSVVPTIFCSAKTVARLQQEVSCIVNVSEGGWMCNCLGKGMDVHTKKQNTHLLLKHCISLLFSHTQTHTHWHLEYHSIHKQFALSLWFSV